MDQVLQILGGGFYLLNKVFLWIAERAKQKEQDTRAKAWRVASWAVYLCGLLPWVLLFVGKHNWIAAVLEAAGLPAMVLGLILSIQDADTPMPKWLHWLAAGCIPIGLAVSVYDFGGLNTLNQWLEIGLVLGFLVGTYSLAHKRRSGYLWFVLMHVSCGWLMWLQNYPWLFGQQAVSLPFIIAAYREAGKK